MNVLSSDHKRDAIKNAILRAKNLIYILVDLFLPFFSFIFLRELCTKLEIQLDSALTTTFIFGLKWMKWPQDFDKFQPDFDKFQPDFHKF